MLNTCVPVFITVSVTTLDDVPRSTLPNAIVLPAGGTSIGYTPLPVAVTTVLPLSGSFVENVNAAVLPVPSVVGLNVTLHVVVPFIVPLFAGIVPPVVHGD
ncbi:MAG TPA: hypothetical protein VGM74_22620, partial [Burkholderiaceae bacterium]